MKRPLLILTTATVIAVVSLSTLELYRGNFLLSFSIAPILLLLYFLLKLNR